MGGFSGTGDIPAASLCIIDTGVKLGFIIIIFFFYCGLWLFFYFVKFQQIIPSLLHNRSFECYNIKKTIRNIIVKTKYFEDGRIVDFTNMIFYLKFIYFDRIFGYFEGDAIAKPE